MKIKLLLILFFLGGSFAFAQTKPIYFIDNIITTDPKAANAYGVYGKLSTEQLWVLKKYDFDDNLLVSGSYQDSLLSIPHGNFTFYSSVFDYNDKNLTAYKLRDTDRYISQKGVFSSGLEEGVWYSYYPDGKVISYTNFIKGKLNGEVKSFSAKGKLLFSGQYKDGLKEGIWYDIQSKVKDVYERDTLISTNTLTRAEILKLK